MRRYACHAGLKAEVVFFHGGVFLSNQPAYLWQGFSMWALLFRICFCYIGTAIAKSSPVGRSVLWLCVDLDHVWVPGRAIPLRILQVDAGQTQALVLPSARIKIKGVIFQRSHRDDRLWLPAWACCFRFPAAYGGTRRPHCACRNPW